MQEKTKNDGLLAFLATVLKKSMDVPEDVSLLAESISILSEKISKVADAVSSLVTTVQAHNTAISELYVIQATIMKKMNTQGVDSKLPDLNKTKSDKPN